MHAAPLWHIGNVYDWLIYRMDLKGSWTELGSFLDYECMPDYTMYVKHNQFISAVLKYKLRIQQCMRLHYGILGMSMID